MSELVRTCGYRYGEIAVITGNLEEYARLAAQVFEEADIPYFIDEKHSVMMNPFVEYLRAAMEMAVQGFPYESVFRYLRCGMSEVTREQADKLENYVLALAAVGDTAEGFERLCDAIEEIDRRESLKYREEAVEKEPLKNGKMKQIMRISQAMDAEIERCPLDECIGRTSGEFAYLYPPGIPLIVPGEQISGHFVKNVRRYLEQGFEVQGLSDQTSETVCVVRNEM